MAPITPDTAISEISNLRQQVLALTGALQQQQQYLAKQQSSVSQPQSASVVHASSGGHLPKIRQPSSYAGAMGAQVDDWIGEMEQQFNYYGVMFPSDAARISYATSYFTGSAMHWWEQQADRGTAALGTWELFKARLFSRYRPVQATQIARQKLSKLRMRTGQHTVNGYVNAFQNVITPIKDMSTADLVFNFVNGLSPAIQQRVYERNPATLKDAIEMAVSIEALGNFGRPSFSPAAGSGSSSGSVPMDVSNINSIESFLGEDMVESDPMSVVLAKMQELDLKLNAVMTKPAAAKTNYQKKLVPGLSREEVHKLMAEGKCFICKKPGHMKNECPNSRLKQ